MRESGNGLDYSASIQELQTDEEYLITFNGRMPLEALTDLVWELHYYCGDAQRTVIAYTNCNRYGLPANAMLCINEKIDDAEAIAVDNQGHVYTIDYKSESLAYKLTDKTARYKSCPRTRTVEKESITVTASKPGLIRRLKFRFRSLVRSFRGGVQDDDEPRWCVFIQLAFWIAFFVSLVPSHRMELPKLFYLLNYYLFSNWISGLIILFIFFGLCFFLKAKRYIKCGPFTILAIIGSPFVFSILANYYITPEHRERVAVVTDKSVDDGSIWVEWRYTDDNNSQKRPCTFAVSVRRSNGEEQLQVGDTCIVDWRQGVMGWPVVRGIVKK